MDLQLLLGLFPYLAILAAQIVTLLALRRGQRFLAQRLDLILAPDRTLEE